MITGLFNVHEWAKHTFGEALLGDKRRTTRLVDIASRLALYSRKTVARSCEGVNALLTGTYRFIENNNIKPKDIRFAGFQQTAKIAQDIPELLALEDTTSMSYKHSVAADFGKLGKETDKARGWWVHSTLLLNPRTMQTIGLAYQEWWCRPDNPADAGEKESLKWQAASECFRRHFSELAPKTISVCDREADIYDYIEHKLGYDERFVVRGKHKRQINDSNQDIFAHLAGQSELGTHKIEIPQKGMVDNKGKRYNRKARVVQLQIKSTTVTIKNKHGKPQCINVVLAEERVSKKGDEALSWLLLTTEPVALYQQALKVIRIYTARWRIEDFHKAWKTGAGAERLRMITSENLERTASILAFIGVRLMQLRESFTLPILLKKKGFLEEAVQTKNQLCDTVLTKDEYQVLRQIDSPRLIKKEQLPSLQWAYLAIARLGGFSDSKRTGIAGWDTLWEGWDLLQQKVSGYLLAKEMLAAGETL
ncbi:MAG: hypothetical protein ACJAZA_000761 [Shewanella psychromarinicola]|jgi:hypothetical protein